MTSETVLAATDLERLSDAGGRYELARGVARCMASANLRHGRVGDHAQWRLSSFVRELDLG